MGIALWGRGIRSLERVGSAYLVVAGPTGDRGNFALYRWTGQLGDTPEWARDFDLADLRPESLLAPTSTGYLQS